MTKEDDYRAFAAKSLDLASKSADSADKGHLLAMAEAWLNLADKIARLAKRPKKYVGEHPAVRAVLGTDRPEAD